MKAESEIVLQHSKLNDRKDTLTSLFTTLWKYKILYLMLLPGLVCLYLFCYGPMYGLIIAFKDFNISKGVLGSDWVGVKHFAALFSDPVSLRVIRNTIIISLYKFIFGIPAPIILALLLNEVGSKAYKQVVQTVSYLPHFISWIIVAGIVGNLLSPNTGIITYLIKGNEVANLMTSKEWFRTILVASDIWKEVGWGSVIYLAALAGVDLEQYEAAVMDGANRIQRMLYITMPALYPLIMIVSILAMGNIMNAGFDQIFNMYNDMVMDVADIIDTYVYRIGLTGMNYSFSSAVGLFKSFVGLSMIIVVNGLAKKISDDGVGLW